MLTYSHDGSRVDQYICIYYYTIYHANKQMYMQIEMQIIISHIYTSSSHLFVLVFYVIRKFSNARGKFWFVWLVIQFSDHPWCQNILLICSFLCKIVIYSSTYLVDLFVPNL